MNTRLNLIKVIACSTFLLAGSVMAQPRAGVIQYITPNFYNFSIYPVTNALTDCSNLNRLLDSYSANNCSTLKAGAYCSAILAQIKAEQILDRQNSNPMDDFSRLYRLNLTENLLGPQNYSKRFDIGYADSYDLHSSALLVPGAFRFEGGFTSTELDVENKINSSLGFELVTSEGQRFLKLQSKIRVCALESGRISLLGKANMNVGTYHPVGRVAYEIVEEAYRKAVKISQRTDLYDRQKNYLLGLTAGALLKRLGDIQDANELDEVALSLQSVILDVANPNFRPAVVDRDSNVAVRILDPGLIIPNADVQIKFKAELP